MAVAGVRTGPLAVRRNRRSEITLRSRKRRADQERSRKARERGAVSKHASMEGHGSTRPHEHATSKNQLHWPRQTRNHGLLMRGLRQFAHGIPHGSTKSDHIEKSRKATAYDGARAASCNSMCKFTQTSVCRHSNVSAFDVRQTRGSSCRPQPSDARADAAARPPDQECRRTRKPWRYSVCSCVCTRGRCAHHGTPRRPTKPFRPVRASLARAQRTLRTRFGPPSNGSLVTQAGGKTIA